MQERFKVVPAVYLVLLDGNSVLLSKRKNTGFYDGWYGLVSGHVDGRESMSSALVREAKEEAGLIVAKSDLKMICVMHRNSDDRESVDFFFSLHMSSSLKIVNCEPDKCSELRFFDLQALPEKTIPFIMAALKSVETRESYLEFSWT